MSGSVPPSERSAVALVWHQARSRRARAHRERRLLFALLPQRRGEEHGHRHPHDAPGADLGAAFVDGHDVVTVRTRCAVRSARCFRTPRSTNRLTAREHLDLDAAIFGVPAPSAARAPRRSWRGSASRASPTTSFGRSRGDEAGSIAAARPRSVDPHPRRTDCGARPHTRLPCGTSSPRSPGGRRGSARCS